MCIVQVETYGSMEKREKVEFILEQMRLCLAKKDYIRTQIISKKINTKYFEEKDTDVSVLQGSGIHGRLSVMEDSGKLRQLDCNLVGFFVP